MQYPSPMTFVNAAWMVFLLYWLPSAFNVKRTRSVAPGHVRLIQLALLVPGILLLFGERYRVGPLHMALLLDVLGVAIVGVLLTWAGLLFAIWARYCLGRNWSSQVVIREDHELIQTGPYRFIRHPIYTGILAGIWGTAMVVGQLGAFVGAVLITCGLIYKGQQEERILQTTFGEAFVAHRQRTGMFLPKAH